MRSCVKKTGPGETHFVMALMIRVKSARKGSASAQQARSMVRFQTGRSVGAVFMTGWGRGRALVGLNSVILQSGISRSNQSPRCILFQPRAFVQLTTGVLARYGLLLDFEFALTRRF